MAQLPSPDEKAIIHHLLDWPRNRVFRIWWLDEPPHSRSIRHCGTGFCLNIGSHMFGVTARHVVQTYLDDAKQNSSLKLYFQSKIVQFKPIDMSSGLDIATFYMDEALLKTLSLE